MKVKFFTSPTCPKCPSAKELAKELESEGADVEQHDISIPDGLAEAQLYQVMATPTIVITDESNNEIKSWRGEVPAKDEVESSLK